MTSVDALRDGSFSLGDFRDTKTYTFERTRAVTCD